MGMPIEDSPLVTFVIYAFNEERYIREAVESAFAQSYSPLEIVLSDDGSSDRTFEIMENVASAYKGSAVVILNRNSCNIGIGSQLTACVAKSKGELILLGNGDDISLPERTRVTVDAWLASGKKACAIYTDLEEVDEKGNPLGRILHTKASFRTLEEGIRCRFGGVGAASLALSRTVFDRYGPLADNLILEDNPLYMRAMLLGECVHLDRPLVKYRVHEENISQSYATGNFSEWVIRHRKKLIWHKKEGVKAYLQMLRDLYQLPAESWPVEDLKRARQVGMEKLLENAILHDYYAGDRTIRFTERWKMLARLSLLLIKVMLKTTFPHFERKSDRWHYDSTHGTVRR
jgi:glycosyltransferase involved in cell wall biosynthesis